MLKGTASYLTACGVLCTAGLLLLHTQLPDSLSIGRFRFVIPQVSHSVVESDESELLLQSGNAESNLSKKIGLYCEALSKMGSAMLDEPFSSKVLLNWANLRQILGTVRCSEPYTDGRSIDVLSSALEMSETNPAVRYSAGLLSLWSGDVSEARSLFKETMKFGLQMSAGQLLIMAGTLESPKDVAELIPPRFPYIVQWQQIVEQAPALHETAEESESTAKEYGKLQVAALLENRREYNEKLIDGDLFQARLLSLLPTATFSNARRFIDRELSQSVFDRPEMPEHRFFDARSGMDELRIVRSFRSLENHPERTPFTLWATRASVNLLSPLTSIGFFQADTGRIKLISLQSESRGYVLNEQSFKVLASHDNENWRDITDAVEFTPIHVLNASWYELRVNKPVPERYWKINYSSSERSRQFVNKLDLMIRVFGERDDTDD